MKRGRMFLAQRRMNELILYTILADVVIAFLLKRFQGANTAGPLVLLYLMNAAVIISVYRFWKLPVFEWDDTGFIFYGISPFKRERGAWQKVEKAGFKSVEEKKGKPREYLVVIYINPKGAPRTGLVPMDMVGFGGKVKEEFQGFLKEKGIAPL